MAIPAEPGAQGPTRSWRRGEIILLAAALGLLLWLVGDFLLILFAAILLAIALDGMAALLAERSGLSRGWALLAVVLGLLALALGGGVAMAPQLIEQMRELWTQLSELAGRLQHALEELPWAQQGQAENGEALGAIAGRLASTLAVLLGAVGTLVVTVAIGLFLAANPGLYLRGALKLTPPQYRPRAQATLARVAHALRWWLVGQLVSMLVLGIVTSVVLMILGVRLWLGLGVLTGLLTFIPFLGPIIAGVPVVLVSFAEGMQTALIVFAFYVVLQSVEGYWLTPMIQQRAVRLPPALLISTQILMGLLFGAPGLILAAPLAAAGMVAVNMLYVEDVLGERSAAL